MKRFYKYLIPAFIMLAIFTGCEKKEEEVHPTETTTTIIEVDKDGENKKSSEDIEDNDSNINELDDN